MEKLVLPSTVTRIEYSAFEECVNLKHVELPNTLTTIERDAFRDCVSLTTINIPDKLKKMESGVFFNCKSLKHGKIPFVGEDEESSNDVTDMSGIYSGCTSLKSVTYSKGVINIPSYAFENCKNLRDIKIPEKLYGVADYAFDGCTKLKEVILSDNVKNIGYKAFRNCKSLRKILIPSKTTTIGQYEIYSSVVKKSGFEKCSKKLVFYVVKNSYADKHAKKYGFKRKYICDHDYKEGKIKKASTKKDGWVKEKCKKCGKVKKTIIFRDVELYFDRATHEYTGKAELTIKSKYYKKEKITRNFSIIPNNVSKVKIKCDGSKVTLNWKKSKDKIDGYIISYGEDKHEWDKIVELPVSETSYSFSDSGEICLIFQTYKVVNVNGKEV